MVGYHQNVGTDFSNVNRIQAEASNNTLPFQTPVIAIVIKKEFKF